MDAEIPGEKWLLVFNLAIIRLKIKTRIIEGKSRRRGTTTIGVALAIKFTNNQPNTNLNTDKTDR